MIKIIKAFIGLPVLKIEPEKSLFVVNTISFLMVAFAFFIIDLVFGFDVFSINKLDLGVDENLLTILANVIGGDFDSRNDFSSYVLIFSTIIAASFSLLFFFYNQKNIRENSIIYIGYKAVFVVLCISFVVLPFLGFVDLFLKEPLDGIIEEIIFSLMFFIYLIALPAGIFFILPIIFSKNTFIYYGKDENVKFFEDIYKFLNDNINNTKAVFLFFKSLSSKKEIPESIKVELFKIVTEHYYKRFIKLGKSETLLRYSDDFENPVREERVGIYDLFKKFLKENYPILEYLIKLNVPSAIIHISEHLSEKGYNPYCLDDICNSNATLDDKNTLLISMFNANINTEVDKIEIIKYIKLNVLKDDLSNIVDYKSFMKVVRDFIVNIRFNHEFRISNDPIVEECNRVCE